MSIFFWQNKQLSKFVKNKLTNLLVFRDNWTYTPVFSSQWIQPNACRLKTVGGVGFEVTWKVTFQESGWYNMYYIKINNYSSRTNRSHKSVNIAWYPCNILIYPSKYCNYTSKCGGSVSYYPIPGENSNGGVTSRGSTKPTFRMLQWYWSTQLPAICIRSAMF